MFDVYFVHVCSSDLNSKLVALAAQNRAKDDLMITSSLTQQVPLTLTLGGGGSIGAGISMKSLPQNL